MLRRDPTRIELRTEDIADFDKAKEEYLEAIGSKTNDQRKKLRATTVAPPPTPADIASTNDITTNNSITERDIHLDPVEVAYQERKGKSIKDRILAGTLATRRSLLLNRAAFSTSSSVRFASLHSPVPLTADTHPSIKRDESFKKLSKDDLSYFNSILAPHCITQGDEDLEPFNTDWLRKYKGQSKLVLKPSSTEQVSKILKYCNENRLAVVPQGGNTGLVGGSIPVFDEIIISMSNMSSIRNFDDVSGALVCDAGCVLETLEKYLDEYGYITPLDLGAKGSCQIGGNVSTNAGGLRLLRYGSLHGSVLGLEVVLPDGTVLENLSMLRKDNTGYDLKQIFIGSEGTLGIVTGVSFLAPKKSKAINVALLGLNSYEHVQAAFKRSKEELSEVLSAFEFWDQGSLKQVKEHVAAGANNPLQESYPFYVLIETSGSNKDHDDEKLSSFLEKLLDENITQDGVVAQDTAQLRNLWAIRESIPVAVLQDGAVYKYDISVPVPVIYEAVEAIKKRLLDKGVLGEGKLFTSVIGYGHIGDGNLHLTLIAKEFCQEATDLIEPYIFEWTGK
ncbi:hypothetical protein BGZ46_003509 [Entomortierella lignicola]|nr:hypothetical protein BGZ46_003509 [Entomortierella lignicola]